MSEEIKETKEVTTPTPETKEEKKESVEETTEKVIDKLSGLMIHGNKSLEELHKIQARQSHLNAGILFTDPSLKIPKPILESLTQEMRFEKPSEIQASTLPIILDGHNVIAQAQSGAGKTIAFCIGMLAAVDVTKNEVQALCLTPTRELAIQILTDAIRPLSSRIPGLKYEDALSGKETLPGEVCKSHIIVGTPGKVKSMFANKYLNPSTIKIFVLDEADKMVDEKSLGAATISIKKLLNKNIQILFFSATYTEEIIKYAKKLVPKAYLIRPKNTEELVLDVIYQVRMNSSFKPDGKLQILKDIYEFMSIQQSIVFVEKKVDVDKVKKLMIDSGFEVSALHGDVLNADRDAIMNQFREGKSKVLITTNVLARGVDVPSVAVVVNYDVPFVLDEKTKQKRGDEASYLHRIGRCGRFGRRGTAITFIDNEEDARLLEEIETYFNKTKRITTEWDPNDVEGLSEAIKERPDGGEINPTALDGNTANGVEITEFSSEK